MLYRFTVLCVLCVAFVQFCLFPNVCLDVGNLQPPFAVQARANAPPPLAESRPRCDWSAPPQPPLALQLLGLLLGFGSCLLFYWAHTHLGERRPSHPPSPPARAAAPAPALIPPSPPPPASFSWEVELRQGQKLVTSGPYAHARHPMYATLLLFTVAVLLASGMVRSKPAPPRRGTRPSLSPFASGRQTWLFAALMVHWIYVVARVRREEVMLLRAFGEEYRAYQAQVGYFCPWALPCLPNTVLSAEEAPLVAPRAPLRSPAVPSSPMSSVGGDRDVDTAA